MEETYQISHAEEVGQTTAAADSESAIQAIRRQAADDDQARKMMELLEVGKLVGRAQSAHVLSKMADVIHVSQLRALKTTARAAGLTWAQACEIIGYNTKTADQYLRLGDALGDGFVADMSAIGVSIRTLETARKLPEEARRRLLSGEAVDLEQTTKEQLTRCIREMAAENQTALDEANKARKKAEAAQAKALATLGDVSQALELARQGLPADDAEAMERVRRREMEIISHFVVIRNSLDIAQRDPYAIARISASLDLIARMAEATARTLLARAEGLEPNDEMLMAEARRLNAELAEADDRRPYPGV